MTAYEIDASWDMPTFDSFVINADSAEDAEYKAIEKVRTENPEAGHITVDNVQEVNAR